MFIRSPKLLLACLAIGLFALGSYSQTQQESVATQTEELRQLLDHSIKTSTFEDGNLKSFGFRLPNGGEKIITVEQSSKTSFALNDGGRRVGVELEGDGKISSIVFPSGKRAEFRWQMMPNGYWVVASVKVDGKELPRSASFEGGDCYAVCRNSLVASGIAAATCLANGPFSPSCLAATVAAAYATYLCYECVYPNLDIAQRRGLPIQWLEARKINYVHDQDETAWLHPGVHTDRCSRFYV